MKTQKRIATRRATRFLMVPVALIAAAIAGCAHGANGARPQFVRHPGQGEQVTITTDNQNFLDADVYAVWNGTRDRIGMVTGKTTQTFNVNWRAPDMQMEVHLISGGNMTTDHISVFQGDNVDLVIPSTP